VSSSAVDIPGPTEVVSVYLAGPMTGLPQYNFPAFLGAATTLRRAGYEVWSPAEHDLDRGFDMDDPDAAQPLVEYMKVDLPQVMAADAVVVLPGWENSTGARLEVHTAVACGKPVLSYPDLGIVDVRVIIGRHTETSWAQGTGLLTHPDAKDTWLVDEPIPGLDDDMPFAGGGQRIVTNAITGGQKETRAARFDLLPWDQLWKVAELYAYGAAKYEDRNWERGYAFSLSIAALYRHMAKFAQGENDDPESGCPHLASVVFHALALLRFVEGTQLDLLPDALDDRPVGLQVRAREDAQ
jgi:nucleoside 2-deoxyribosyltransferase